MAQQTVNVGAAPNDGTGDNLRAAFGKLNANDAELYAAVATKLNVSAVGTAAAKNVGTGAGNVPVLDASGLLDTAVLPAVAITDVFVVASQAAMLALTAQRGDMAIRSDLNKTFVLATNSPTTLADWKELLSPTDQVLSVAGLTGAISASSLRTALSLVIGTDVQGYDAELSALAGLTGAADKVPVFTGPGAATLADLSTASQSIALTWGANTSPPNIGNGSLTGRAAKIGPFTWIGFKLTIGSTTTFGSGAWYFQAPSPFNSNALVDCSAGVLGFDAGTAFRDGLATVAAGDNKIKILSGGAVDYWQSTIPQTWASGDFLSGSILIPTA